jgi:hypothetical protein
MEGRYGRGMTDPITTTLADAAGNEADIATTMQRD